MAKDPKYDLTQEQFQVIRKLLGKDWYKLLKDTGYSKRTIEAVLQGRRRNPVIIDKAVVMAFKELRAIRGEMDLIENSIIK